MVEAGADRVQPLQVKDQVYERIRQGLIEHDFKPGEPLRESALTQLYGVSKTPIREALVRLQQDGLVQIAAYRGARASTYSVADLVQLHEAREILEVECARRAAARPAEVADHLEDTVTSARQSLAAGDLNRAALYLDEFDEVLFALLDNSLLEGVRQRLTMHLRRAGRVNLTADGVERSLDEHVEIVAAVGSGDEVAAEGALRRHLHSVRDQQIAALEDRRLTDPRPQ